MADIEQIKKKRGPRIGPLNSATDAKRILSSVLRKAIRLGDRESVGKAYNVAMSLSLWSKIAETADLERRIAAIEKTLKEEVHETDR
jgi:hypothetical protein